jgi:hypothetical protein
VLARYQIGALLVIARQDSINELLEGGIAIGAAISPELLEAIFQKLSPLHDGAGIIKGDQLVKANVVLPLTQRRDVPAFYGTRHRAALGLAERCDALVVVVSEERGEVTLMHDGKIQRIAEPDELAATLDGLLSPSGVRIEARLHRFFHANLGLKFAALGLAGVIWAMSFLAAGTTIRTMTVPVELSDVPAGTEVTIQSADTLEVQVRGSPWIMDSVSLGRLVGRFDLGYLQPGWHTLRFQPQSLDLPPGIVVDRVTPETIRVEVAQLRPPHPQAK